MCHPKESTGKFHQVDNVIISHVLVHFLQEKRAPSLDVVNAGSVLDYLHKIWQNGLLHVLHDVKTTCLYCLFEKLQCAYSGCWVVAAEQSDHLSYRSLHPTILCIIFYYLEQAPAIINALKISDLQKLLKVIVQCLISQVLKPTDGHLCLLHLYTVLFKWMNLYMKNMQSKRAAMMQGSIRVKVGVKEIHVGEKMRYALLISNQYLQVLDLIHEDVSAIIRRMAYPRGAKISKCERFIVAYFTDNTVGIYSTADGSQLSKIMGVPRSIGNFVISGNSQRLLFANNQTLCLWSIPKGELQITSSQWRNINCYAIRDDGNQIAIGTYSGALLILTLLTTQRVTQMQVKKHSNCVMMIGYTKFGEIISLSYDKHFIKTTICDLAQGGKGISYDQIIMQTIPRSIQAVGNIVFFIESDGSIGWITNGNKLMQYSDGIYTATECENHIIFMKYKQGCLQWFQALS